MKKIAILLVALGALAACTPDYITSEADATEDIPDGAFAVYVPVTG